MHRRTLLTSASALLALSLSTPTFAAGERVKVVASIAILGDMVSRIGGDHVELTTLVGPGGDAHVFQPTPRDAAAVSAADILVMNGLGLEGWLERLTGAAGFNGDLVVTTSGMVAIAYEEGDDHDHGHEEAKHDDHGHDDHAQDKEHDHDHGDHAHDKDHDHDDHGHDQAHHDHDHGEFDPHGWHDFDNAIRYVDNITAALAKADPAHAGAFYANRAAYVAEIEAVEAEVDALMAALPESRRTIVTSHDAFGYFGARYGLDFRSPQGLSTESDPSAADVARLITQIREEGISALFVESITDNRMIQMIASETDASIGGTLYSGTLSGPAGPAATYLEMMRHNARTISAALGS